MSRLLRWLKAHLTRLRDGWFVEKLIVNIDTVNIAFDIDNVTLLEGYIVGFVVAAFRALMFMLTVPILSCVLAPFYWMYVGVIFLTDAEHPLKARKYQSLQEN